jgi:phosphoglycerate dehydrogenase-like enzyme
VNVLFRFDASEALRRKVTALSASGIHVVCCAESEDSGYARLLPEADVLWHVLKPVTADHIQAAPKLKLIQKIGSGVNTIALDAAKSRGIAVCNLPGTNSRAVAEMALLLMLACLRRLPELHASVKTNQWEKAWALQDSFGELGGRIVGLVGYGAVGRILSPMLEAMGARVLFWSRSARNAELDALLSASDIVSLHLPLTPQTERILDPRKMKAGAILINTARGGLVHEGLLLDALRTGHLAAAGLDVYAAEPAPVLHPLISSPNVVCAPHLAWLTQETLERSLAVALDNVERLRDGRDLLHRVL